MVLPESYCSLVAQTFDFSKCSVRVLHHRRQIIDPQGHSSRVSLLNRTTFLLHQKLGLAHGYLTANLAKRLSALLEHAEVEVPDAFSFDLSFGNVDMLEGFAVQGDLAELDV